MTISSTYLRARAVLRAVFRRQSTERDMQHEMRTHLERSAERLVARGLSPTAARAAARREFGNVTGLQEEGRAARGPRWIESVIADLHFAVRHFARKPLSSLTIVSVLALGIGVHAALFAVIQAVTMRPAPGIAASDALVRIRGKEQPSRGDRWYPRGLSYPEFQDIAQHRELFASVAGWTSDIVTLDAGNPDETKSARAQFVTGPFFETVGVRPAIGSLFHANARVGDEPVAVLGHALWLELFSGTPDVPGRTIRLNDVSVRIIGVAAARFNGATPAQGARTIWLPLETRAAIVRSSAQSLVSRDTALLSAVGRLSANASIAQANAAVRVVSARATSNMVPLDRNGVRDADVVSLAGDTELPANRDALFFIAVLGIGAALILVVACTNVSALVVGAGIARRQEITVRLSLGASRARIIRQLVTESCVLAVCGGLLGLGLFWAIARVLVSYLPDLNLAPDVRTIAFTLLFALGTGVVFGLSPALHATRRDLASVLKGVSGGATSRSRLQSAFVVVQIAVTQPLLVGLCLLFALVLHEGGGGMPDSLSSHLVRVRFDVERPTTARSDQVRNGMRELAAMPGVIGAVREPSGIALVDVAAVNDSNATVTQASAPANVHIEGASPGYFALQNVPIIRGRDLELGDTAARDLAVVIGSDRARLLWHGRDPVGQRLTQTVRGRVLDQRLVVVGVFDATRSTTRGSGERVFAIDTRTRNNPWLVRTAGPAAEFVKPIRARLHDAVPGVPIGDIATLTDIGAADRDAVNHVAGGAAAATGAALLLASIGLYGVVGLAVAQRRREIGIRMALGARASEVVMLLFRVGVRLALLGLVIGLPFSVVVLTLLAKEVGIGTAAGSISTSAPVVGLLVAAAVLVVAAIATWLPARKAAYVDPMIALRTE